MKLSSIHLLREMTQREAMQLFQINDTDKKNVLKKYRQLSAQNHPDLGGDPNKMKKINQAFFILTGKEKPEPEKVITPEEKTKNYLELWKKAAKILEQKHSTIFNNCRRMARGDTVDQSKNSEVGKEIIERLGKGIQAITTNKLYKFRGVQIISKSYVQLLEILDSSIDESKSELLQLAKSATTEQAYDNITQCYRIIIAINSEIKKFLNAIQENNVKVV